MQVKKFEARSMREALEMVKTQLGPDAIILSAREVSKGFGLVGQSSVEITAAISDATLQKKRFAESRLRAEDREKLAKSPARVQKEFIDRMVSNYEEEKSPRPTITSRRYIDIGDMEAELSPAQSADLRIKDAAQRAWRAMQSHGQWIEQEAKPEEKSSWRSRLLKSVNPMRGASPQTGGSPASQQSESLAPDKAFEASQNASGSIIAGFASDEEINLLRSELSKVKQTLERFQKVPQSVVSTYPGADVGLPYEFSSTFEKLTNAGIATDLVAEILTKAHKEMPPIKFKNRALIEGWVAKHILDTTRTVQEKSMHRVQVFVGPAGSGKTSTLVKLASHYVVNENKKVAIVTIDTGKVGAIDQLRIYSQILNVPFAIIRTQKDWDYVVKQLHNYDYILCDGPGLGLRSLEEITRLKALLPSYGIGATIHLTLSSAAKDSDLQEVGKRYGVVQYKDVIFTGLDESVQHGNIYNFIRRFDVPLHSFGIGQKVPEDYELATKERVLDLIFKLTKMKKG